MSDLDSNTPSDPSSQPDASTASVKIPGLDATLPTETAQVSSDYIQDSDIKDSAGVVFDANIHCAGDRKTKDGRWKKRGGRGLGVASSKEEKITTQGAAQSVSYLFGSLFPILYGEGGVIIPAEIVPLTAAVETYLIDNDIDGLPPGLSVTLHAYIYANTIAMREQNRSRTKEIFGAMKRGIKHIFGVKDKKAEALKKTFIDHVAQSEQSKYVVPGVVPVKA